MYSLFLFSLITENKPRSPVVKNNSRSTKNPLNAVSKKNNPSKLFQIIIDIIKEI